MHQVFSYFAQVNEKVDNKKIIEEWKLNNEENYTESFTGILIDRGTLFKGNPQLQVFHAKGFCF